LLVEHEFYCLTGMNLSEFSLKQLLDQYVDLSKDFIIALEKGLTRKELDQHKVKMKKVFDLIRFKQALLKMNLTDHHSPEYIDTTDPFFIHEGGKTGPED